VHAGPANRNEDPYQVHGVGSVDAGAFPRATYARQCPAARDL